MADGAFSRDAFDVDAFDELAFDFGCASFDEEAFDTEAFDSDAFCFEGVSSVVIEAVDSVTGGMFDPDRFRPKLREHFDEDDIEIIEILINFLNSTR